MSADWTEVWIDDAAGHYVLLLRPAKGKLEVVDPQEGGRVIQTFDAYEGATSWLREDEYELVEGRWHKEA